MIGSLASVVRRRLDAELVRRGMVASRSAAARLIEDGRVLVSGSVAEKSGRMVGAEEPVHLVGPPPRFVGRGAEKLLAALDGFGLDPSGLRILDAGASTGGFTDCLLQHGAAAVTSLDVGHGQIHERLRRDPRVEVVERTNIRSVDPVRRPLYDAVVADLSFISLRIVLDVLVGSTRPGGWLVVLVKPQFEAGRAEVAGGRGVISDPVVWRRVIREVVEAAERAGSTTMGVMVSPLHGADGNTEFLLHLRRRPDALPDDAATLDVESSIDRAVEAGREQATRVR